MGQMKHSLWPMGHQFLTSAGENIALVPNLSPSCLYLDSFFFPESKSYVTISSVKYRVDWVAPFHKMINEVPFPPE